MEMKAPTTTAQPHPPSGGVQPTGPPGAAGMTFLQEDDGGATEIVSGSQNCGRKRIAAEDLPWDEKTNKSLPLKSLGILCTTAVNSKMKMVEQLSFFS